MARILGISTALPYTEIALIEGDTTCFYKGWPSDHNEAEKLMPALKEAILDQEVDKVFVVKGPGGFTGLRIGVTMANTIADQKGIGMLTIDTFKYLFAKLDPQYQDMTAVVLRAGGGNVAVFTPDSDKPDIIKIEDLPEFVENMEYIKLLVTDLPIEKRPDLVVEWLELEDLNPLDYALKEILKQGSDAGLEELDSVEPVYINSPKITPSKKQSFT